MVNRIGDFGFLVAMFLMLKHFGTLEIQHVMQHISTHPELQAGLLTGIALLLVLGATGKSAQIPLYVWLPDAMEGPTPVSALIHAATMVTAGVYMVARSHVLFDRSPAALTGGGNYRRGDSVFRRDGRRWCRQISSACWLTPQSRSLGTCSWLAAWQRTRQRSSIS